MDSIAYHLFRSVRPRQWIKNGATYAALVFSGLFFFQDYAFRVTLAFIVFSGVTSAMYLINDLVDAPHDRKHPFKKKRPIASGDLPVPVATFAAIAFLLGSLFFAYMLSFFFFVMCLSYLALNVAYTTYLKRVPILDVLSIAAGFILRVYAGAVIVDLHMSVWFLLTVISVSLFMAVGKRQSERTLLTGFNESLAGHRETLSRYTPRLLDIYTGMFANATWLSYALFAFQQQFYSASGPLPTLFSMIPRAFVAQKWLMITVPLVIYGVMRYLQLVYEKNKGESPERVLLSDKPLLMVVSLWIALVFFIIYVIG